MSTCRAPAPASPPTRSSRMLGIAIDAHQRCHQPRARPSWSSGEIDAVAYVAGAPAPVFRALDAASGPAFPADSAASRRSPPSMRRRGSTAKEYPGLVPRMAPVDTVAVGTVLMAANLAPAVRALSQRREFRRRILHAVLHAARARPSSEMARGQSRRRFAGLAARSRRPRSGSHATPPWRRSRRPPRTCKAVFEHFLDERLRLTGNAAMSQQQKDDALRRVPPVAVGPGP